MSTTPIAVEVTKATPTWYHVKCSDHGTVNFTRHKPTALRDAEQHRDDEHTRFGQECHVTDGTKPA